MAVTTSPQASAAALDKTLRSERSEVYPHQVWYLVGGFIALVALFHWVSWAVAQLSKKSRSQEQHTTKDVEAGAKSPSGRFSVRRLPLALVNLYRIVAFRCTLQIGNTYTLNLAEVFVTCAYIAALFTWNFINTTTVEGHKFDISYWGNRAGSIASSQFPLVTVLGTKNNVLSYITGISYDKLNYIHRMTARVTFVLLWVHSGAKLSTATSAEFNEWFARAGLIGTIAFSVLIIVSLRPIRARAYELFFFTHFMMVLIFLVGGWYHANQVNMGYYLWPCFVIWGFDRVVRVARVLIFNHLYFLFSSKSSSLDADIELLSPECVRLRMERPSHFRWRAGQTAYLIMPGVSSTPFEAHPFTIASIRGASPKAGIVSDTEKVVQRTDGWNELVFLINVRNGFTKRLAEAASLDQKAKVLVDGPYGFSPDLDNDDTVVLVSGGSGVSFTLATFSDTVNRVREGRSKCRRIVFIWAIRDPSQMEWISTALGDALEAAPSSLDISVLVHITARSSTSDGRPRSISPLSMISMIEFPSVQVVSGRPDFEILLKEEAEVTSGRMSVTVCGSQAIASACRAALRFPTSSAASVAKGGPDVVLHVESFGYA
ncbi:iron reductase [Obba rivulosa]|uniref:ferric-chelate reductase (NADPH) n=1 Tax=Obba rivulosa TaxID=1052685 RepID=A0A8E2B4T5_9APHY|nr:iron reductase [Obba rivulosa]